MREGARYCAILGDIRRYSAIIHDTPKISARLGVEEAANILTTSDLDGADDIVELEFAPTRDFVPRWMNASAGRRQSAPVTRGAPVQGGNRPHSTLC